jgi:hypothetical protein
MLGNFEVAERLAFSQEALISVGLVSFLADFCYVQLCILLTIFAGVLETY